MKRYSELKFKDLVKNASFVKIIWNKEVIYDDYSYLDGDFTYNRDGETVEHLNEVKKKYGNKYVYELTIKIVEGHHCIINVKGEK